VGFTWDTALRPRLRSMQDLGHHELLFVCVAGHGETAPSLKNKTIARPG